MTKEHAELLAEKQKERKVALGRLTSYPEYYVLKEEIEKMIESMRNIDNIDETKDVLAQVRGNKMAKDTLTRFLSDMNVFNSKAHDTRNETYE